MSELLRGMAGRTAGEQPETFNWIWKDLDITRDVFAAIQYIIQPP